MRRLWARWHGTLVAWAWRQKLMSHYLYVEIDGVQRFVFASPKLKFIRGGSAMLDLFNRVEMLRVAGEKGGEAIFAGGGHCLIRGLSRSDAESIGRTLERGLKRKSDGQATLLWAVTPADPSWPAARRCLEEEIQRRRSEPVPAAPPLPPFVALCSCCGAGPARELADMRERHIKPLCGACLARQGEMKLVYDLRKETVWQRLRPHLGVHAHLDDGGFKKLLPQRELEDLAAQSNSSKKYLAYLYCDGNGMGRALADAKSVEEYGDISTHIDGALHQAVAKALAAHCPPGGRWDHFRAEVLLLGGDDLIVALPAECAVRFTEKVLKEFFHKTACRFRLSAGLVFAPPSTPITILQQTAEKLLRSAKRRAYLDEMRERFKRCTITSPSKETPPPTAASSTKPARSPADGYIDFQELASSQSDIEREHTVTCRPYRLDDFMTLAERTRNVDKCNVPRGRLHALAEAIQGSRREAHTMTQLVIGRAKANPKEDQQAALLALLQPPGVSEQADRMRPFLSHADKAEELPSDLYDRPGEHRWSPIPDALELIDHVGSMDEVP